jgi:hypothetical protein
MIIPILTLGMLFVCIIAVFAVAAAGWPIPMDKEEPPETLQEKVSQEKFLNLGPPTGTPIGVLSNSEKENKCQLIQSVR